MSAPVQLTDRGYVGSLTLLFLWLVAVAVHRPLGLAVAFAAVGLVGLLELGRWVDACWCRAWRRIHAYTWEMNR